MSAANYLDLDLFKTEIGEGGSSKDDLYTALGLEASRVIDRLCRVPAGYYGPQTFTKTFDSDDESVLYIPPLISVTSLKTDEDGDRTFEVTWDADADFRLYPLDGPPYTRIERDSVNGSYYFPIGSARVQLAGSWGEAATVPEDIERATRFLANRYRVRPNTPEGVKEGGENMMALAAHDPDILTILRDGRRIKATRAFA